jgi:uncharacterized protein (TIGR02453 family)
MPGASYFTADTFAFLRELAANNERAWFQRNRDWYIVAVLRPAIGFIMEFGPRLQRISPHFRADPRPVGGSLFRIHRDTRFSRDKSPYKTHIGIQFRHVAGKDVHAPGFYLHIEPRNVFVGVGLWHPDARTLRVLRQTILSSPSRWHDVVGDRAFTRRFELAGDVLSRAPRGIDAAHPLVEDLKRKDYVAVSRFSQRAVTAPAFADDFAKACRDGSPLVRFLCESLGLDF